MYFLFDPLQVGVFNFNPFFKNKGINDYFYIAKHFCSEITEFTFPEDILAAEYDSSNDVSDMLSPMNF